MCLLENPGHDGLGKKGLLKFKNLTALKCVVDSIQKVQSKAFESRVVLNIILVLVLITHYASEILNCIMSRQVLAIL